MKEKASRIRGYIEKDEAKGEGLSIITNGEFVYGFPSSFLCRVNGSIHHITKMFIFSWLIKINYIHLICICI